MVRQQTMQHDKKHNQTKLMTNRQIFFNSFIFIIIIIFFSACGIDKSRKFGSIFNEVNIYTDSTLKTTLQAEFYEYINNEELYIDFKSSKAEIEIQEVNTRLIWLNDNDTVDIKKPTSTRIELFKNSKFIKRDTIRHNNYVPTDYKNLTDSVNIIYYTIAFLETGYFIIPDNVDKINIDLELKFHFKKTNKVESIKKTISLKEEKKYRFWFLRDC